MDQEKKNTAPEEELMTEAAPAEAVEAPKTAETAEAPEEPAAEGKKGKKKKSREAEALEACEAEKKELDQTAAALGVLDEVDRRADAEGYRHQKGQRDHRQRVDDRGKHREIFR